MTIGSAQRPGSDKEEPLSDQAGSSAAAARLSRLVLRWHWLRQPAVWYAIFAAYAGAVAAFSGPGLDEWWGIWAVGGYAVAAVLAACWRGSRGRLAALAAAVAGALVAPVIWLVTQEPMPSDGIVVSRSAQLLVHHGTPYLSSAALAHGGWLAYNPYLPVMALFGLPKAAGLPGLAGDTRPWLVAATFVLLLFAFRTVAPGRALSWSARRAAFATSSPLLAFPLALGITDPPITALVVLAIALLTRPTGAPGTSAGARATSAGAGATLTGAGATLAGSGASLAGARGASAGPPETSAGAQTPAGVRATLAGARGASAGAPETSAGVRGLVPADRRIMAAALVLGVACAVKYTAWPALAVLIAMIAARDGARTAVRFTVTAVATAVVLAIALAPAAWTAPAALIANTVAYPLGLTNAHSPAQSPLPGHILATLGPAGHATAIALLVIAGLGILVSLVVRPPLTTEAATRRLALSLILLFALSPATRFGYLAYPLALYGWLALTSRRAITPAPAGSSG